MRFDVISLFPEIFDGFLKSGITRRAFEAGQVDVQFTNPRDFSDGAYRRVDDRPFGGGPGMVLMAEPLKRALHHIRAKRSDAVSAPLILFSPVGKRLEQAQVQRWASSSGAVLLCGRYEGLDQRFIDSYVDEQVSLGDYVLSGGEVAAMVFLDAVARLQEGVLGDEDSHKQDSFNPALDGLLDCPHFTRPEVWSGKVVPEVLVSGHHLNIRLWRREQSLLLTLRNRPDLIVRARQNGALSNADEAFLETVAGRICAAASAD